MLITRYGIQKRFSRISSRMQKKLKSFSIYSKFNAIFLFLLKYNNFITWWDNSRGNSPLDARNLSWISQCDLACTKVKLHLPNISQQRFFGHCAGYYRSRQISKQLATLPRSETVTNRLGLFNDFAPVNHYELTLACTHFIIVIGRKSETKYCSITDERREQF